MVALEMPEGFFRTFAAKFASWSVPAEDLVQEMRIGYWQASQDWKPNSGAALQTYCLNRATGRARHYVRDYGSLVRIPGGQQAQGMLAPGMTFFGELENSDSILGRRDFVPFLLEVLEPEVPVVRKRGRPRTNPV